MGGSHHDECPGAWMPYISTSDLGFFAQHLIAKSEAAYWAEENRRQGYTLTAKQHESKST